MRSLLVGALLFLGFASAHAASAPASEVQIKKLVQQYDAFQTFKYVMSGGGQADPRPLPPDTPDDPQYPSPPDRPPHRPNPPECDPEYGGGSPGSCIEAVCNQLSYFDCNSRDKLIEITRMCRNVRGSCVKAVCSRVSSFQCDERSELGTVTQMCKGLYDTSCIDYVCSRLPRWDCDELIELRKIADQCR